MKREIPVFQYDDAWQILARGDRLNGLVIDAGSEEVMLRIEASMSKLKVMGDDDRRFFWIWAQVNKREREWLQVLTAHYNDFHYLILSDNRFKMAVLQNAEGIYSNKVKYRLDVKEYLLALETHVKAVVDWICEAPEEYHAYVERYLPYDKRDGDIPRKVLYSIDPGWHDDKDDERLIRGLEEVKAAKPSEFDSITLRTYITVWSAAYRILSQIRYDGRDKGYERKLLHDSQTMDDIELFMEYANGTNSMNRGPMTKRILLFDYPDARSIAVCGDIHGAFEEMVFKLCVQYEMTDTLLIVAGDCGFGFEKPGYYDQVFTKISRRLAKANNWVVMIRRNHDDPAYFQEQRIHHERFRCIPDYSIVTACGHTILCIGGAISIDRTYTSWSSRKYYGSDPPCRSKNEPECPGSSHSA